MADSERVYRACIQRERPYRPFGALSRISNYLMKASAKDLENGVEYYGYFVATIVLTTFSFEGFLNDLGQLLFDSKIKWDDQVKERLKERKRAHFQKNPGWIVKVDVIAAKTNINVDFDVEPWSTIRELFEFRNSVAHPSFELLETASEEVGPDEESLRRRRPLTTWETKCTREFAEFARSNVDQAAEYLANSADLDLLEFVRDWHSYSMKAIGRESI